MKLILTIFSVALMLNGIAQNTILTQDFNAGMPAGWQLINNDNLAPYNDPAVDFITDAFVITEDYDSTGIGDNILVATSWHATEGDADDYLILPKLTMGSIGNYISFDAKSVDASHPDGLEVRISTGGVNVWDFYFADAAYANPGVNPYWTNYVVSLDSVGVANQDIFIAFRHTGNDNFILAIDNIKVWIEDPISVSENVENTLSIFPNPTNGILNLNVPLNTSFQIMDLAGKVILNESYTGNINVSEFSNGVYFIKIEGYATTKFIKN
jgi:hypothetical protein